MQGTFFKSRHSIPINFSKSTQNISISTTSNKWQLSNFNTKVCFNDEILKLQMHQSECEERD